MSRFYIDTEEKFHHYLPNLLAYQKEFENPKVGLDFEAYSLTGHFPRPITYYGADKEELERKAFERSGLRLRADDEGHMALMQIGLDPLEGFDEQYLFDMRKLDYGLVGSNLKNFLESSLIIGHSLTLEASYCIKQLGIWLDRMRDLKILGRIIHAGDDYDHSLMGEYKKFIDPATFKSLFGMTHEEYAKYKKENQKSDWTVPELSEDQLDYGADDVRGPMFLYDIMKKALNALMKKHNKKGLMDIVRLDNGLINEFAMMTIRGVPFNSAYHQVEVIDYLTKKYEEALQGVGMYFTHEVEKRERYDHLTKKGTIINRYHKWTEIEPINMKAPGQIKEALLGAGVKLPLDKKTKKPSTGALALKKVRDQHPAIEHMLRAKKAGHLLDNYGQCLIDEVHSDGRIHPNFNIIGAKTGRSSSSEPNKQKIPMHEKLFGERPAGPMFRGSFTIPLGEYKFGEEWVWISADLSQIEPHMIGQLTGDKLLCQELNDPDGDLHALAGQLFMDLDYKPIKRLYGKTYERDTIGKTGDLQVLYRAGAKSFAEYMYDKTIDEPKPVIWTRDDAQDMINKFFAGFPEILEKMREIDQLVDDYMAGKPSLKYFANRKPVFEFFTNGTVKDKKYTRYEKWCLTDIQEGIARKMRWAEEDGTFYHKFPDGDPLHKDFVILKEVDVLDENGEPTGETKIIKSRWNHYNQTKSAIQREAWNFWFQGECANLFKLATLRIGNELRQIPGFDPIREGIISVVHDEINLLVRVKFKEQVMEIVQRCMKEAGREFINKVPIKLEIGAGDSWATTH